MKKRMIIMGIALAVVFGGIILFNLFKSFMIKRYFASYEAPPVSVSSAVAQKVDWKPFIPAVGNFVAINGVDVNSQASGNVVKLHFDSGQNIQKEQPLIDIDDSVEQTILKYNQAELTLKGLNYKRQSDLFKRGATPSSSVDESLAFLQEAQANVEKIQAEIRQKHITAPFTGRLGIRQVNLGQFIKPGDTAIVTLQSLDPLYLEFYLPEQMVKRIQADQPITFRVDEFPNALFEGKITAINAKVDPNTHNIQIQATVPNCPASMLQNPEKSPLVKISKDPENNKSRIVCNSELNAKNKVEEFLLLPGMFASIEVSQPAIPNTIILPSTAISYSLYGNAVYIIEKDKNNAEKLVVNRVFVSTGEQRGNYTVITKGVREGQRVVSAGEMKLQNGASVVINNSVELKEINDPDILGQ